MPLRGAEQSHPVPHRRPDLDRADHGELGPRTPATFYGFRALLGVAEAGFFPGIIYYLTHWYPERARARAYAWFLAAIPICGIIGGPISAALLSLDGWLGLRGWQWLFLLEGIPSVLVGLLVLRLLPERPRDARWLSEGERAWLTRTLEREQTAVHASHAAEMPAALPTPLVWWLGLSYFLLVMALYGFTLWLPQLLKAAAGFSNTEIGFASALCYAVAAVGMVLVGRRPGRTRSAGAPSRLRQPRVIHGRTMRRGGGY